MSEAVRIKEPEVAEHPPLQDGLGEISEHIQREPYMLITTVKVECFHEELYESIASELEMSGASHASLSADHIVREDLMLGPENVEMVEDERQQEILDLNQAVSEKLVPKLIHEAQQEIRSSFVKLERLQHELSDLRATHAQQSLATRHAGATGGRQTSDTNRQSTRIYICDTCSKTYKRKHFIIRHIKLHDKLTGFNQHECEECGKKYKQKCHLDRHKRVHTKQELYTCDICKKMYTRKNNLRDHKCFRNVKRTVREKLYVCQICHKQFTRRTSLKVHKIIHTGEKPYKCEICLKQFTQSTNIKRHMRTHTGEMPYTCKICSKNFTRSSNLQEHLQNHSGQKYCCNICKRQYKRLRTLRMHEKTFHN